MEKAKKKNKFVQFFADYFADFGFRQLTGIVLIAASAVLIVGMSIPNFIVLTIGFAVFAACGLSGVVQSVLTMIKNNRRSPQYKRAVISLVCMALLLAISVVGIIFSIID